MKEGSTEAPTRHVILWQDSPCTDMDRVLAEMTRVFDICHGCRRCFNLCDSFPKLFDSRLSPLHKVWPSPYAGYRRSR